MSIGFSVILCTLLTIWILESTRRQNGERREESLNTRFKRDIHLANYTDTKCERKPMIVDFEQIGWSSTIISPRFYNAYHCLGHCSYPLGVLHNPTNHAVIQSIINHDKIADSVDAPCCTSDELLPISLLYYNNEGNVVLKTYEDMITNTCACL